MTRVIATGDYRDNTSAAIDWLKDHGATVEDCSGVSLITLSPNLDLENGAHGWQYIIGDSSSSSDECVEVQLDADVNETMLFFRPAQE